MGGVLQTCVWCAHALINAMALMCVSAAAPDWCDRVLCAEAPAAGCRQQSWAGVNQHVPQSLQMQCSQLMVGVCPGGGGQGPGLGRVSATTAGWGVVMVRCDVIAMPAPGCLQVAGGPCVGVRVWRGAAAAPPGNAPGLLRQRMHMRAAHHIAHSGKVCGAAGGTEQWCRRVCWRVWQVLCVGALCFGALQLRYMWSNCCFEHTPSCCSGHAARAAVEDR